MAFFLLEIFPDFAIARHVRTIRLTCGVKIYSSFEIGPKLTCPSIYFLIIIFYRITILPSEDKFIPMFERLTTFHQDFMTQYKD